MKIRLIEIVTDDLSADTIREILRGLSSVATDAAPHRASSPDNGRDYDPHAPSLPVTRERGQREGSPPLPDSTTVAPGSPMPRRTLPRRPAQAAAGPQSPSPCNQGEVSGIGDRPRTGQGRGSSSPCTQGEGKGEDSSKARHPWRKTIKNNLLICLEKPGQTFTPDQAAALAGVSRKALLQSVTPSMISKGYKTGGLSFRRAGDARPALSKVEGPPPDHEARPRHSNGLSTARNPYMVGAAARVPQAAEYPTEAAP